MVWLVLPLKMAVAVMIPLEVEFVVFVVFGLLLLNVLPVTIVVAVVFVRFVSECLFVNVVPVVCHGLVLVVVVAMMTNLKGKLTMLCVLFIKCNNIFFSDVEVYRGRVKPVT